MKLMIASDIHGSSYYCNKMLKAYKRDQADKLLLLGDLLYHGPRNDLPKDYNPKEVIEILNERKEDLLCVRGNCEADVDQQVLEFPVLAEYCMLYIDGLTIFASHGHKYNEENLPPLGKGSILLNGHTHISRFKEHEDFIYMNPGSISIPKGDTTNSYILLENKRFYCKDLEGNVLATYEYMI